MALSWAESGQVYAALEAWKPWPAGYDGYAEGVTIRRSRIVLRSPAATSHRIVLRNLIPLASAAAILGQDYSPCSSGMASG